MADIVQLRRGTAAAWTAANTVLAEGEAGLETDTTKLKFGDGVTAWNSLDYFSGDQNLFGTIAVSGQSDIVADAANDTLTFVAGTNITITTDATTDSITINSSGGGSVGPEIYAFAARHG